MVITYKCVDPEYIIYVGRDKFENEDLIRYAFESDIWFHVEHYSSAHVYVRPPIGKIHDELPPKVVQQAAQIVKANSIEGHKASQVNVVYTPAPNLLKTSNMEVGSVSFVKDSDCKHVLSVQRDRETVKAAEKSRREEDWNLQQMKADHVRELQHLRKAEKQKVVKNNLDLSNDWQKLEQPPSPSYADLKVDLAVSSNKHIKPDVDPRKLEEDFM